MLWKRSMLNYGSRVSEALDALSHAAAEGFRRCRNPQLSAWASIRSLTKEADEL